MTKKLTIEIAVADDGTLSVASTHHAEAVAAAQPIEEPTAETQAVEAEAVAEAPAAEQPAEVQAEANGGDGAPTPAPEVIAATEAEAPAQQQA